MTILFYKRFFSVHRDNTPSCRPWITFTTPGGMPAWRAKSIRIMVAPGSRSDGLIIQVFPQTVAKGNICPQNNSNPFLFAFTGLVRVRILAYIAQEKHSVKVAYPKGNHGWEVEGCDAGYDTKRHAKCESVHVFGNTIQCLAKLQGWDATAVLHHLWQTERWEQV